MQRKWNKVSQTASRGIARISGVRQALHQGGRCNSPPSLCPYSPAPGPGRTWLAYGPLSSGRCTIRPHPQPRPPSGLAPSGPPPSAQRPKPREEPEDGVPVTAAAAASPSRPDMPKMAPWVAEASDCVRMGPRGAAGRTQRNDGIRLFGVEMRWVLLTAALSDFFPAQPTVGGCA